MSANRVIGGLLALIGGGLVLIGTILTTQIMLAALPLVGAEFSGFYVWIVSLIIGILAAIGGILAMAGRSGALALIIGLVMVITTILLSLNVIPNLSYYIGYSSLFALYVVPIPFVTMEGILVLVGGIIAMPGGD